MKQLLFFQGAGNEGYESDKVLAGSLRTALGKSYQVNYPTLQTDETLPDYGWPEQIGREISIIKDYAVLVGHSLGASMLLKFLSEHSLQGEKRIVGIFLISTPFWSGDENWKKGLKLQKHFADRLPKDVPIFLYHSRDDQEVPFSHLELYKQALKHATFREIPSGGHQLNNDLTLVASDVKSISPS